MNGSWGLVLRAAVALVVGLLCAQEVHHRIVVSGEISEEGALLDLFQGGLSLAVDQVEATPVAQREAVARSLSSHFGCPVRLGEAEGPLPRVSLDEEPIFTVEIAGDSRVLIIGPIPDPSRLDRADRHSAALIAVVAIILAMAASLVLPVARRLYIIEQTIDALAAGQHSARAPVRGTDVVDRLATRLNALATENERLLAAERGLLQAVAHELRAPCQRLRVRLESVRDGEPAAADAMDRDLDELDALAGELLVFLRYGKAQVERQEFPPLPRLAELVEDLTPLHPGVRFVLPETAPSLTAEPRGFVRVMHNLLSNAARYAVGEVTVHIEAREGAVWVVVEDDGPGIPKADRQRIFEPFARVDDSRSRDSGGAGLGLAIAQRILSAHGGQIVATGSAGGRLEMWWPQ